MAVMRTTASAVFIFAVCALVGCRQYAASTPRELLEGNDAANYRRVFGESPPSDVSIVNSVVVKYESRLFVVTTDDWEIEVVAPRAWIEEQISDLGLDPADQRGLAAISERKDHPIRSWYAPKPVDEYDLYYLCVTSIPYVHMLVERQQEPDGRFRTFVSKH